MNEELKRTVQNLAIAIIEKQADEEEVQQLNDLMREHPEARQIYLSTMDIHFDLDRMSLTGALAPDTQVQGCEPLLRKVDKMSISNEKKRRSPHLLYALAALVAVSLSLLFISTPFQTQEYQAVVIESSSASTDWKVGSIFKTSDILELNENEKVKLRFGDETVLEVKGPISTVLDQSGKEGRKLSISTPGTSANNKLVVNSGDTELHITAPKNQLQSTVKIIESGNAFGIRFQEKLTEIHVFKGAVTSHQASSGTIVESQKIHHLQAAAFNKDGLLKKWTKPDFKNFNEPKPVSGVRSTNRHVHWMSSKPSSLKAGALESNESIFLIQEKKNVVLPHEIPVTFSDRLQRSSGGTQSGYKGHVRMLPKGTKVDSYLLHFDPATSRFLDGDIFFERKIIAIIARGKQLDYSDKFFALDGVEYPAPQSPHRGLDGERKDENVDVLKFRGNPYEVGIRFNIETDTIDQIRILVESE